jgi:hypothetical protein
MEKKNNRRQDRNTGGPVADEPIIHIFLAICVNKLGFNTRD